eukprot:CAMPEP_0114344382 /NCGR_PEP_ID=MMETSP0101-20121206/11377_1 /TAXON_ID=38822 ORGANISM="Pteridomonas danica, Strain PT" /NCGR_SAMPLE_ID=MMETSP0101 /ASSEMBLY_ACC=CAM_ASM_000211 /LENGTH=267 /DNA_ID=CAMNT_0001479701 /DNA_START=6 /DNA_END=809 /DNA_ORIENTATION=-
MALRIAFTKRTLSIHYSKYVCHSVNALPFTTTSKEKESEWVKSFAALGDDHNRAIKIFDQAATKYDDSIGAAGYQLPKMCSKLIKKHLFKNIDTDYTTLKILDVGCGTGLGGEQLVKDYGFKNVTGIDLSEESLAVSKTKNIYSKLMICSLDKKLDKINDNEFDVLICLGVLTYIQNKQFLFNEFSRIIKPNGIMMMSHRQDFMMNDKWIFNEMEKVNDNDNKNDNGNKIDHWKCLELTEPFKHLPDDPSYGDHCLAHMYVAQNKKC